MGLITKVLSVVDVVRNGLTLSDIKGDPGAGANQTSEHYGPAGDDSKPLPGDYYISEKIPGSGRGVAVGYLDPTNAPESGPGEKRLYSRDSGGAVVAEVWLKNDGTITAENDSVAAELKPDGSAIIDNGIGSHEIAADGTVTTTSGIGSLTMTPTGLATLTNGTGTFLMLADGSFSINGVVFTPAGVMISASGKNSDTHTHPQGADSNGDTQANTGAPL